MKCEEAQSITDLYINGELPLELEDKLNRHLLRCSHCAGDIRSIEQTRSLLRAAVSPAEPTASFRERTAARLHGQFAQHLRANPVSIDNRQWTLPFSRNEV